MDRIAFGRGVRALRLRRRWRQEDLSTAAGLSRGAVARIEQGHADTVTVATLDRIAAALGARVMCRLTWNGEALDRLLDAEHAAIVEHVVRLLRASGWLVATEVSFNIYGERGSIDVFAYHAMARVVLVVEVKSVVPDVQDTLVTLDRKTRLAPRLAAERGWPAVVVARLLVIRDDRTARRRTADHAQTFDNAFPARARDVKRWLQQPIASTPLAGLWFVSGESHPVVRRRVRHPRQPSVHEPRDRT